MAARTNVANAVVSMIWAITPEKLAAIEGIVERFEAGIKLDDDQVAQILAQTQSADPARRIDEEEAGPNIAVVPITDTLMNRASLFDSISGATSYQSIAKQVRGAADDDEISHILLDFDTPGGTVDGVDVAADAIRYAKGKKPVIAAVNDLAASAGYWLASQADQVYVNKTSVVGSIGVMYAHLDVSEAEKQLGMKRTIMHSGEDKAIGHPSVPLSDEHKEKIQKRLDLTHQQFISSVAAGRGMEEKDVKPLATGFIYNGEEAVKNGLADGFGSIHSVIQAIHNSDDAMPQGKEKETQEKQPVQEPAAQTPAASTDGEVTLQGLMQTVNSLAQTVGQLATQQKAQAEEAAKQKAQALINPLIQNGAVSPAKGEELIQKATTNYDLVESLVQSLRPNMEVPYDSVVEPGMSRNRTAPVGGESRQVFQQLGLMDANGKINLKRVTLPLDGNGQMTYMPDNVRYAADRVAPEVQQVMGQFGQWVA